MIKSWRLRKGDSAFAQHPIIEDHKLNITKDVLEALEIYKQKYLSELLNDRTELNISF